MLFLSLTAGWEDEITVCLAHSRHSLKAKMILVEKGKPSGVLRTRQGSCALEVPTAARSKRPESQVPALSISRPQSMAAFLLPRFNVQNLHSNPWGPGSVTEASGLRYFCSRELQVQISKGFVPGLHPSETHHLNKCNLVKTDLSEEASGKER
jgi:hypothetical protein